MSVKGLGFAAPRGIYRVLGDGCGGLGFRVRGLGMRGRPRMRKLRRSPVVWCLGFGVRCRANMADIRQSSQANVADARQSNRAKMVHIRQSRLDSSLYFQVKVLTIIQVVASSIGSGRREGHTL